MNPPDIEKRIEEYIARHSGFETRRTYLSISHLSECPRKVIREYRNGYTVDEHTHRMAFAGYETERNLIELLKGCGLELDNFGFEVGAMFDPRLRGHIDALADGDIIVELKSISRAQFEKLIEKDKALWKHFTQVQMYMRYAGKRRAIILYRCRDTYEHKAFEVPYIERIAHEVEERAKKILTHIDAGTLPTCECGKCAE